MENTTPVVRTRGLTKTYDHVKRVDHLDLTIGPGQIYGFLGPNGAGKSTTMKMLLGLARPSEGTIEIFGKPLDTAKSEILARTGSLIEAPSYYPHLTALENMKLLEVLLDLPEGRAEKVLKIVRLEKDQDRKVADFSLGMKQRLGIAAALIRDPKLLILDEPINGLDPAGIEEIRELLRSLAHDHGITIMISSHLLDEIEKLCDHIGILESGKLIYQGSMEALDRYRKPACVFGVDDPVRAAGMLNGLGARVRDDQVVLPHQDAAMRARINQKLVESGVAVSEILEEQKSLEDLFLDLTGRGGAV